MISFTEYREYLNIFFNEFDYTAKDATVLNEAFGKIASSPDAAKNISDCIEAYDANMKTDFSSVLRLSSETAEAIGVHRYTTDLLVFILLSKHLKELYAEHGYPEEVFHKSLLDLKYKLEECKLVKGVVGSFVAKWFVGFFTLERFALGRLQFELVDFGSEYGVFKPKDRVINTHIPRDGTPMDEKSCAEAFAMAKEWFKGKATDYDGKVAFYCDSWLLYPEIIPSLDDKSNIKRFCREFEIFEVREYRDGHNLWRLFDTDEKDPDRLPADSHLRRIYIDRLRKGLPQGSGKGFFFM